MSKSKAKAETKTNKPLMRGLHQAQSLRNVYTALACSAITATTFYFLYNRPRKMAYKEFYKTYDAEKSFNRMMNANLLSSCPPQDEEENNDKDNENDKEKDKKNQQNVNKIPVNEKESSQNTVVKENVKDKGVDNGEEVGITESESNTVTQQMLREIQRRE